MSVIDSALCTVSGWYWYCDACDTHGNADGEEEARYVAWAHEEYQNVRQMDDESCDLHVFRVGA